MERIGVAISRMAAANGYAGALDWVRGKVCNPDTPGPYEKDGVDSAVLSDWSGKQPWSDGRVGMYGGSYSGGTGWVATKHMTRALKAIMVSVHGFFASSYYRPPKGVSEFFPECAIP